MKKLILLSVSVLFAGHFMYAQRTCGAMHHHEELVRNNPEVQNNLDAINRFTEDYIRTGGATNKTVITIPVVVHVVYNTTAQNISDAQIQSQIAVLNKDFRKLNSDASLVPSTFAGLAADCEINFCLATVDPNGAVTTGIERVSTSTTSFIDDDKVKSTTTGGCNAWNSSKYLNLWVCKLGSSLLGYAQFPGGPAATDGVVINYTAFGTSGSAVAPFNKGRTSTHEIGHWLNLYHIGGDQLGGCGNDQVSDTPTQKGGTSGAGTGNDYGQNFGCPSHPLVRSGECSGTTAEMFMNYMDYTDDGCMYMFSAGQKSRMQALFAAGGARVGLVTSNGCGGTVTPSYCTSNATNTSYEWIGNVTLGTINNTTGSNGGYGNFTALSTNLTAGSAYTLSVKPSFASSSYTEYFNVYIDYNNDMDWVDAGELVYSGSGTTTLTASITIPAATSIGTKRMRVVMKDGAITSPCGSYTYGEVEDYTVNIQSGTVTCNVPSGLSAGSLTSSSAALSWTAVSGASNYTVQVKPSTSSTWTSYTASTNSLSVTGLTASTLYNWQVRTNCTSGSSAYTVGTNFTTSAVSGCTDAYESNNGLSAARLITVNTNITAMIGTSTDVDWFKFTNTSAAPNIKVTMTNLPFDYDLYLYNSAGTLLYSSENGTTTAEAITYNGAPVATYYIKVMGYSSAYSATSCYTLKAATSSSALKVEQSEETTVQKAPESVFMIMPNPSADGKFTFNLTNIFTGKVMVDVYDESGRIVFQQQVQKTEDFIKEGIDLSEKNRGMYIVKIYNDAFHVTERILYVK